MEPKKVFFRIIVSFTLVAALAVAAAVSSQEIEGTRCQAEVYGLVESTTSYLGEVMGVVVALHKYTSTAMTRVRQTTNTIPLIYYIILYPQRGNFKKGVGHELVGQMLSFAYSCDTEYDLIYQVSRILLKGYVDVSDLFIAPEAIVRNY